MSLAKRCRISTLRYLGQPKHPIRGERGNPGAHFQTVSGNVTRIEQDHYVYAEHCDMVTPPIIIDNLGLVAALEWLTRDFQDHTGLACLLQVGSSLQHRPLNAHSATALFLVSQEFLTHVIRHAESTQVDLDLRTQHGRLERRLKDNGKGMTELNIAKKIIF